MSDGDLANHWPATGADAIEPPQFVTTAARQAVRDALDVAATRMGFLP